MRLVIMGPPGAGKGTQGERLARRLGVPRFATGDMLREAREAGTRMGREAARFMDAGELVPDEVVLGIVREALEGDRAVRGFLLDGFPRTLAQARGLESILEAMERPLDVVLYLDVPEEELIRRLTGRQQEEGRSDDRPETVRRRLQVYREETEAVLEWYRESDVPLREIDGTGTIPEVERRLWRCVQELGQAAGL